MSGLTIFLGVIVVLVPLLLIVGGFIMGGLSTHVQGRKGNIMAWGAIAIIIAGITSLIWGAASGESFITGFEEISTSQYKELERDIEKYPELRYFATTITEDGTVSRREFRKLQQKIIELDHTRIRDHVVNKVSLEVK